MSPRKSRTARRPAKTTRTHEPGSHTVRAMRTPFWQRIGKVNDSNLEQRVGKVDVSDLEETDCDYSGSVEDLEAKISRMLGGDEAAQPGGGGGDVHDVSLPSRSLLLCPCPCPEFLCRLCIAVVGWALGYVFGWRALLFDWRAPLRGAHADIVVPTN